MRRVWTEKEIPGSVEMLFPDLFWLSSIRTFDLSAAFPCNVAIAVTIIRSIGSCIFCINANGMTAICGKCPVDPAGRSGRLLRDFGSYLGIFP